MTPPTETFAAFYAAYLEQHRDPANRALHLLAKALMLLLLVLAGTLRAPLLLLGVPIVGVAPCWLGHLLFEHNRPTSWTRPAASLLGSLRMSLQRRPGDGAPRAGRPYYSFLADLRMCAAMLGLGRSAPAPEAAAERESDRT